MSDEDVDKLVEKAIERLNIKIDSGDLDDKLYQHTHEYLCNGVSGVLTEEVIANAMENACKTIFKNIKTDGLEKTIKEFLEKATLDACEAEEGENDDEDEEDEEDDEDDDEEDEEDEEEEDEKTEAKKQNIEEKKGGRRRKHKRTRKRKK
jgi:hypothetical protein